MITLTIVFLFLDVIFILLLRKLYKDILNKLKQNAKYTGYFLLEKRPPIIKLINISKQIIKDFDFNRIKFLTFVYTFFIVLFTLLSLTSFTVYLFI